MRKDVEESDQDSSTKDTEQGSKIDLNFLNENGFESIEYVNRGKFGQVYSGMANDKATKMYAIDKIPEGGVIGENIWQLEGRFFEEISLDGIKVAIKYLPHQEREPWDDSSSESEPEGAKAAGSAGGIVALLSSRKDKRSDPLSEVRKLINLNHPNLVDVYNVLEDHQKGIYIVMEFFEMNLNQWIEGMKETNERLDDQSFEIFLTQLINGLEYLHNNNIYHNDLHSGNVMVTLDDKDLLTLKYVDFGESEYFNEFNSPAGDIKGLGHIINSVMSLLDSDHPEFREELQTFAYTSVKGHYENIDQVKKEFENLSQILSREDQQLKGEKSSDE